MRNLLSKIIKGIATRWSSLAIVQKVIVVSVGVILFAGIIFALSLGTQQSSVLIFTNPIEDATLLDRISIRLDEENIAYKIEANNTISVSSTQIARRTRNILIREGLLPTNTDPWELFDVTRWTQTDFERNVNLRRSITRQITQHIEALDDIDNAQINLVMPER